MNCLNCARTGVERTAVALCPDCQACLCLEHMQQAADAAMPGGMHFTCAHGTGGPAGSQTSPRPGG